MKAKVSIIMGSTSDMPVMQKAANFLDEMKIPFEKKNEIKSSCVHDSNIYGALKNS